MSSNETGTQILSLAQSSGSDGQTRPFRDSSRYLVISIYNSLLSLRSHRSGRNELKNVDLAAFPHQKLNYLPTKYNGNIVFELPALSIVKSECWSCNVGGHGPEARWTCLDRNNKH